MLAHRRLNSSVQVLDPSLIRKSTTTTNNETSEEGREGLVVGGEGPGGHSEEMVKGIDGIANSSGQERPQPPPTTFTTSQGQPPSMITYAVSVQVSPSATSRPEGGARIEIESLPGQNQNKPKLDDAKIEAPALPGINQDLSNMGEAPKPLMPAAAANAPPVPDQPTITVNKPLPGQNQIMPPSAPGPLAPGSTPPGLTPPAAVALPPPPPPPPPPPAMAASLTSPSAISTLAITTTPASSSITTSSQTSVSSSVSLTMLSPLTSFVTITRSEQGKENAPTTTVLSSTQFLSTASATTTANPQAIAAAQSLSVVFASTGAIATATSISAAAADAQDGSILHPTMRTLLVVFVILGVLSVLVAIVICMMVRSHKKRRAQQQSKRTQNPYDASSDSSSVMTYNSTDSNDNPFLTASEKAIINRAASSNGASEVHNSSRISDAVDSFVKKSRSLAYKISP